MQKISVREAERKDVKTLFNLIGQLAEYERLSHQVISTEGSLVKFGFSKNPLFKAILAEFREKAESSPVGFALYYFTYSTFVGRPTLYIEDIFVVPEYRGRGIGKALFEKLVQLTIKLECGRMEWAVLDWNESAIRFYKSLGATPMSDWTVYRLDEKAIEALGRGIE